MRLLKTQMSFTRLCWREFERPSRDLAHPQGSHELESRQPVQVLRVPFPEGWVLRSLSHDRILHQRVAKMINDRGDGEDAAKPFIQTLLRFRSGLQRQCHCEKKRYNCDERLHHKKLLEMNHRAPSATCQELCV